MKIAVSVGGDEKICPHLGKAKIFLVFVKEGNKVNFLEVRETEGNPQNHIISDIEDCQVVISGEIGEGMMNSLQKNGIKGVVEKETTDVMKAIQNLEV